MQEIFHTGLNLDLKMFDSGIIAGLVSFLSWVAMSILKFIITPSLMIAAGYEPWEIILVTFTGATLGVMIFYHTGKAIFTWWANIKSKSKLSSSKTKKSVITPGRRKFIQFKNQFGLIGLLLTSVLVSVPISSMLAAKYFNAQKNVTLYLILSFFTWAVVLTFLSWRVKNGLTT